MARFDLTHSGLLTVIVLQGLGSGACADQHTAPPAAVARAVGAALAPTQDEKVIIHGKVLHGFPRSRFYVGVRYPPAGLGGFEDPRPARATVVPYRDSVLVVTSLRDLPALWAAYPGEQATAREFEQSILELLDVTGLVPTQGILHGSSDLERRYGMSVVKDTTALAVIAPPNVAGRRGGWRLRLFVDDRLGVSQVTVSLDGSYGLQVESQQLTAYLFAM